MPGQRRDTSVAGQLFVWQAVVVLALVAGGVLLAWLDARHDARVTAEDRALVLALSVADSPTAREALVSADSAEFAQPFAEQVRRDTDTDFVVIMRPDGTRLSHPNPANIGRTYQGSIAQAREGERHVEEYTGSLGPSVRAIVPVFDDGAVIGMVAVGIRTAHVQDQIIAALPSILLGAAIISLVGAVGVWLINRRLRRATHGLGEREITRMYEYYDAVLRAVREGLVLIDAQGRVSLLNDEARRLLPPAADAVGRDCGGLGLDEGLTEALRRGDRIVDEVVVQDQSILVVSVAPASWRGESVGAVMTIRDQTELSAVSTELDTVRSLAESLRSQSHESANRMHTMVSLLELGRAEEAVEFGVQEIQIAQGLTDRVLSAVDEPVVAAVLLGKSSQAAERGVRLEVDPESVVTGLPMSAHDVVTVVGNLLDNAIDAAQGHVPAKVRVLVDAGPHRFDLRVEDSGDGIEPDHRAEVFTRGWSTKTAPDGGRGLGLALVGQVVRRHDGRIKVGESPLGGAAFDVEIGEIE